MSNLRFRRIPNLVLGLLIALIPAAHVLGSGPDQIRAWSQRAAALAVPNGPPVHQTRLMAIYQLAVHDAVNGITGKYETYLSPGEAPAGSSPTAAAIAGSYRTICALFGQTRCNELEPDYLASLAAEGLTVNDPGVAYGMAAANALLASRANDGAAQSQFFFDPVGTAPGIWHPTSPTQTIVRPGWGAVTPFILKSASQFRPDPPPALDSDIYLRDLEEVRVIGRTGNDCSPLGSQVGCRTPAQNAIAVFWLNGSPVNVWNQPLHHFSSLHGFDISKTAWAFAMLNMTAADSGIACWEAKFGIDGWSGGYNFWRPQAAINYAEGNTTWRPMHTTPGHPEYPSGHTTNSTAMATILSFIFGDYPGDKIRATVGPRTGEWDSFSEAADEVIEARIYSGIHFRNTDEVGSKLGAKVARFAWTHALKECKGNGTCK